MRMLDESSEIAQVRCIKDVTSDLRENYMKFDTEGNGKETEEGLLGEPKSVQVVQSVPFAEDKNFGFYLFLPTVSPDILQLYSSI